MSLMITLGLGLFFLIGIFVIRSFKNTETIEQASVALAFGAMIAIALFDIMPDIVEDIGMDRIYIPVIGAVIGFVILKILDAFIPEHEADDSDEFDDDNMVHIGIMASFAIMLHNIIEGMAVYNIAESDTRQGLLIALGIGLHNIPMGMFIYSTLSTEKVAKKHIILTLAAVSTFIGGLIMLVLSPYMGTTSSGILYGVALGMLIYIICLELLPFIIRSRHKTMTGLCSVAGLAIVLISTLFE